MSHDIEASYAAAEAASLILGDPSSCFSTPPAQQYLSAYAAREGRNSWPHADGVLELSIDGTPNDKKFSLAVEFKRPNEGIHGILTAVGQAHAYLHKGYAGSLIVVPNLYSTLSQTGAYLKDVLDTTSNNSSIGVIGYDPPDMSQVSPFAGKLSVSRSLDLNNYVPLAGTVTPSRTETQWAHLREGSSDPDAFFKYLQMVKLVSGEIIDLAPPTLPPQLADACARVAPGKDPEKYISYCPNDTLPDIAWRKFWFRYVLNDQTIEGWAIEANGTFSPNSVASKIEKSNGSGAKLFFVGRSDSIKNKLVAKLNNKTISHDDAYDQLVRKYHARAHSYREDIDSGCEHLGFVDNTGRLTDQGYRFVDACERTGNPNVGLPRSIFLSAILREGGLGAFLHYIYKLSEIAFGQDPLAFTKKPNGNLLFDQKAYRVWLEGQMENELKVIRKVSQRGGASREPFQAEFAVLRNLGILQRNYRIGVGAIVNWPEFQQALEFSSASQCLN
ncbi:hypothetical protein [Altererythrobacter aquiaggeris]|uniref:hypothetical protein n=1 Tax=Aestuarierythrobacter aquiaggeris TaxID=1898396 RepID=UPI0030164DB3